MYCIKCGVELADSERVCPLCGTRVFHPDLPCGQGEPPYPPADHFFCTIIRQTEKINLFRILPALYG